MSAEKGSSKADTLVKVVLVFFISLLSFSVGTFVGKQVSDSDQRRIALEGEYKADRNVASAEGDAEKISDKEVESLTEEFVNKEKAARDVATADESAAAGEHKAEETKADGYKSYPRGEKTETAEEHGGDDHAEAAPAAKTAEAPKAAKPAPAAKTAKADGAQKAAEKVAHDKAPTDGHKEDRKPTSALPAVASSAIGKYTVQVGSYPDENEAKSQAAALKAKGWSAFYLPANVQGKTWFRVSVGLFEKDKDAKEFRAQFMKETNTKSALVQKIVQ